MLAHQGGWDELILPMAVLLIVFGVPSLLRRRRTAGEDHAAGEDRAVGEDHAAGGRCAYCGELFAAGARRCSACGFRAVPE